MFNVGDRVLTNISRVVADGSVIGGIVLDTHRIYVSPEFEGHEIRVRLDDGAVVSFVDTDLELAN